MKLKLENFTPDTWCGFVVRTGKNTCREAVADDIDVYIVLKVSKNGVVDAAKPKTWAANFSLKAMRRFVRDANYAPWKNKHRPRFLDWIYFA